MNNLIIKVAKIEIYNIKNVKKGNIDFNLTDKNAAIIAIYGQNGSGKTAIINAIDILKNILTGKKVNSKLISFINKDSSFASCIFEFEVFNDNYHYRIIYSFKIDKQGLFKAESLTINDDVIITYNNNKTFKFISKYLNERDLIVDFTKSLIFNNKNNKVLNLINYGFKDNLIKTLITYAKNNLFIISMQNFTLSNTKIIPIPLSNNFNSKKIMIKTGNLVVDKKDYSDFILIIDKLSLLLNTLVPNTKLIYKINNNLNNNTSYYQGKLYSVKGQMELDLSLESEGIKKIISILSALIAVYNNESFLVAIDELDASVFEYLLGELLNVLTQSGKGQLLFTSHNLRVLEVINKEGIYFSTTNPLNKFIKLTNLDETFNLRAAYLRAIELGGPLEEIYESTNIYEIKRALRIKRDQNEN